MQAAAISAFGHYLDRIARLLDRIADADNPQTLLTARPAPGRFCAAEQLGIATGFAARGLCAVAGRETPDIGLPANLPELRAALATVRHAIGGISPADLSNRPVTHSAGQGTLTQPADEFLLHYALPNMLFHLSLAYAALASAGMTLGKADFDGLHTYAPGFSFPD
ncbi:hypothetical protein ACMU_10595 [Actibacterium mucosum KCTC 23349]|uniref:DUF1993 domain-containing protein n=1 Tax=Actibacterium mucosum KCTC 23349 TaxID=1454373 RepID=A0A037ZKW4_9RHOB|nr:DUF1993 family protein [Actibacterium mucosum]KAJ56192.1 hypothetical protein ACMU_10595 [Actibacterium mucosum KCTC 23349]